MKNYELRLFLLILSIFMFNYLMAQGGDNSSCNGTLGENIFTDGDFGSGTANVLQKDPLIAPGYTYTTNPPPYDGYYLITNDLGRWSNTFMDWFAPKDNSSDPNGYMMVVNASFTPGLFYKQTINGLCENTRYVFSADVLNLDRLSGQNRILPNVSFAINGMVRYSTGNVPHDQKWKTYDFTFVTDSNQTSLELSLINNAPGGLGNDLAIDNISFRPCGPMLEIAPAFTENICEDGAPISITAIANVPAGESVEVQWQRSHDNGMTWTDIPGENKKQFNHDIKVAGTYLYRVLAAGTTSALMNPKCRTISPTKVINVIPKNYLVKDTICQGLSYLQAGKNYTTTGIFVDQLVSVYGCDSIVTLDLTVVPQGNIESNVTVESISCSGEKDGSIDIAITKIDNAPGRIVVSDSLGNLVTNLNSLTPQIYNFEITDRFGCQIFNTVEVESVPPFTIDLGPNAYLNLGQNFVLNGVASEDVISYQWLPVDVINCNSNCLPYTFTPLHTTSLTVQASSINGCIAIDSITIFVNDELKFTLPNIISLSKGSKNGEVFIKDGLSAISELTLFNVYDRWGNLVQHLENFLPDDSTVLWNGITRDDKLVEVGVYTFILQATMINQNKKTMTGNITVVK